VINSLEIAEMLNKRNSDVKRDMRNIIGKDRLSILLIINNSTQKVVEVYEIEDKQIHLLSYGALIDAKNKLSILLTQLIRLENDNKVLINEVGFLKKENKKLIVEVEEHKIEVEKLVNQIGELKKDNQSLANEVFELKQDNFHLKKENESLKLRVDKLEKYIYDSDRQKLFERAKNIVKKSKRKGKRNAKNRN